MPIEWQPNRPAPPALSVAFDGGGAPVQAGSEHATPVLFACTITGWSVFGDDDDGECVVDVQRATWDELPTFTSIAGTEKPTLDGERKARDLDLSTWIAGIDAGDYLRFVVESHASASITQLSVALHAVRATG